MVVLHILGSDFPLSRYMAARLADRGVAALFLKLPYYGERRPEAGPGPVPDAVPLGRHRADDDRRCGRGSATSGAALCWLASRPNVDPRAAGRDGDQPGGDRGVARGRRSTPGRSEGVFLLAGGDLSKDPLGHARDRAVPAGLGASRAGRSRTSRP